ncbi:hypothetical protein MCOR27_000050 [Pyricularia oryzae]|uniref:non-specific serine/threonine protein kinase n=1 Tax=Pyricularia grisea TaxID=148305 RepID=A0ABQ8NUF1_PYRGI|nr:hypothetical protein MCOR19_006507 [Pyricularia oryzae]KAI6289554.1 hypothetical protein MCOR27_000050 [Pyricularia oryzae]KAI6302309.1 hypothetical protein MCOR33_002338 [Pyricularia grisea]KAI6472810.1 hypothetical protein MCOR18_008424 [Pyricularia oryzae]KAI6617225.1 hypothetical protein MCOR14_010845 [Pyricularia oryzae]
MTDRPPLDIIRGNPIESGLDAFRASFNSLCTEKQVSCAPNALSHLDREDLQSLTLDLLFALQTLPVARRLPSKTGPGVLRSDLVKLISAAASGDFDFDRFKPLLLIAIANNRDDAFLWDQVYRAVTEATPPSQSVASSLQTPWLHNTGSFANSSEYRQDVDKVLRSELGPLYVGLPCFWDAFFGRMAGLRAISENVFKECTESSDPLFCGERKLDVGLVDDPQAGKDSKCLWSQILVPGELKSNPFADTPKAWLNLGRYAKKIIAAQNTRRFILGFTLCGPFMRLWEFDRLGGIASEKFDINEDGLQFITTILGFLWMSEEDLGFDPTIVKAEDLGFDPTTVKAEDQRFIIIDRNGRTERLVIDELMARAPCIAGRATTCWRAHPEGDPQKQLVIKDSWQYTEREEKGDLLQEATAKGVVNVARHYHHYTVQIHGMDDDIRNNVRKGLEITTATNYRPDQRSKLLPNTIVPGTSRRGRTSSGTASKRSCSASPANVDTLTNRVHRRVILRDYGKPIYKASSRSALLAAVEGCIEGHESLRMAGFLHRDISINNLMINEDIDSLSWPYFLIDLDFGVPEPRAAGASGIKDKAGTRAFMAIGALLGEQHTFMHNLESFFWVLFWIYVHYNGPNTGKIINEFDQWNYISMDLLAKEKKGQVSHERDFIKFAEENFTPHYQPLVTWVNKLRKAVFPNGGRWEREEIKLYAQMKSILREARGDPEVSSDSLEASCES